MWSGGTKEESESSGYPLLSTAVEGKLFHPNCKDTTVTYFEGVNTKPTPPTKEQLKEKEQNYRNDQKLKYIDRNIDKYKRLELGSIDTENVEKYHNKRLQWQEYKKQFKKNTELSFNDVNNNLDIPDVINNMAKQQNQTISQNVKNFVDKNVKDTDIVINNNSTKFMRYKVDEDKIVINTNHKDKEFYNIEETIAHETVHLKDIRENITKNNIDSLGKIVDKAKMYVDNNYSFYYNYLQGKEDNMAISDILSALTNGKLEGNYIREKGYWSSTEKIINELSANIISADLANDELVIDLLNEIPPLKEFKEEIKKLWEC